MCRYQSNKNTHSLPLSYRPRSDCPYLSRDTTARMYPYPPRGHMFAISLDLALRIITSTKCKSHQVYKIVTEEMHTGVINTTINSNDDISVENSYKRHVVRSARMLGIFPTLVVKAIIYGLMKTGGLEL